MLHRLNTGQSHYNYAYLLGPKTGVAVITCRIRSN